MTTMANRSISDKNELCRGKVLTFEIGPPKTEEVSEQNEETNKNSYISHIIRSLPSRVENKQYIGVILCGFMVWGSCWLVARELVVPGGYIFDMAAIVVVGYIFGHTLERYTTIHPVVGMTLIGAICRTFTSRNFLENSTANAIDFHLRRIYPLIILTKGPLGWNWTYIKRNSVKVFSLATLPWTVECLTTVLFAHILLGYPWYWGLHLGSILASVSPAVVIPTTLAHKARGLGVKKQISELVANAGGLDTTYTEGIFGVVNSALFFPSPPLYRIIKAVLAIFVGIALGIVWGVLADTLPDHNDLYAPTIRTILILTGGLFITYGCGYLGWGGTSGVAIMVCAGVAGTRWSRRGWPINNNPVAEVYKLLWRIFEPILFVLSGYYLEVSEISAKEFGLIVACIFSALTLRLLTAFLIALASELSVRESIYIAITWIPKAIVEAVLVRVASDSVWTEGATLQDKSIAKQHSNIIIIAILLTSSLGSILTTALGPTLLSQESKVAPEGVHSSDSASQSVNSNSNNTLSNIQYIDGQ